MISEGERRVRNAGFRPVLKGIFVASLLGLAGNAIAEESWLEDPLRARNFIRSASRVMCEAPLPENAQLTLADAVHYALCNNPQTRASWANVEASAATLGSS